MSKKPKILLFDIETSPNISYTWHGKYDQTVIDFKKEWELLSFGYKWLDEKTVHCITRNNFKDKTDKSLTKALWKIIDEADIIIAHNGLAFDIKKSNAKFIEHGLTPPSPYKVVDTLKVARNKFKFNSNRLNDLGRYLGVGEKVKTGGFDLWLGCMANKAASWKLMVKYNKQDVLLLERVYKKLLAWITNHPNLTLFTHKLASCTKCGSDKLHARGTLVTQSTVYHRFQCQSCGGWDKSIKSTKTIKAERRSIS